MNIPSYFEEILCETDEVLFSKALLLYNERYVMMKSRVEFINFCNYQHIQDHISKNNTLEFIYQKVGGFWMKICVLKFKIYTSHTHETLWIFSSVEKIDEYS